MDRYQAEEVIERNLRVGAVEEYVDGDTALEMLGEIVKLFNTPAKVGVPLVEHLRQVNLKISGRLSEFCDQIVSDNVDYVIKADAEDRRNARSDYRELTTERVH